MDFPWNHPAAQEAHQILPVPIFIQGWEDETLRSASRESREFLDISI